MTKNKGKALGNAGIFGGILALGVAGTLLYNSIRSEIIDSLSSFLDVPLSVRVERNPESDKISTAYQRISEDINNLVQLAKEGRGFRKDNAKVKRENRNSCVDCYSFSTNGYCIDLLMTNGGIDAVSYQGIVPGREHEAIILDLVSTPGLVKGADAYVASVNAEDLESAYSRADIQRDYLRVLDKVLSDLKK